MCNILPKLTIGSSPDSTDDISWGKSFLDTPANDMWEWSTPAEVTILKEFTLPDFDSLDWNLHLPKKKNYGKHSKHINKILKKMGR